MNQFKKGLITENPTFVQVLGMCPTLAVTTSVFNGIGMGLSATLVLICSNLIISLLRKIIPQKVRIAAYIVIIATFVSIVEMLLKAFLPALADQLGIFIPLIVVNCIILARAEAFASKNKPLPSAVDGLAMGLGFTVALTIISAIREILGNATLLTGTPLEIKFGFEPALMMVLPPGGFLTLGLILGVIAFYRQQKSKKQEEGDAE